MWYQTKQRLTLQINGKQKPCYYTLFLQTLKSREWECALLYLKCNRTNAQFRTNSGICKSGSNTPPPPLPPPTITITVAEPTSGFASTSASLLSITGRQGDGACAVGTAGCHGNRVVPSLTCSDAAMEHSCRGRGKVRTRCVCVETDKRKVFAERGGEWAVMKAGKVISC